MSGKLEFDENDSEKTEKNSSVEKRLEEIKSHFGDLITDEAAKLLAEYSLGILHVTKVCELKNRRGKVLLEGVVESPKAREKAGSFILKDDSGAVRVVLWNDAAELIKTGDVAAGDTVRVKGLVKDEEVFIRDASDVEVLSLAGQEVKGIVLACSKAGRQYNVAFYTDKIEILASSFPIPEPLPARVSAVVTDKFIRSVSSVEPVEFQFSFTPIRKVIPLHPCNIRGFVTGIGEERAVRGGKSLVTELVMSDGEDSVRAVFWDDAARHVRKVAPGDVVEIYNGYAKIGRDGEMEVNVGFSSAIRIVKNLF